MGAKESEEGKRKYNSWNVWNYIDKLNFMKLTEESDIKKELIVDRNKYNQA